MSFANLKKSSHSSLMEAINKTEQKSGYQPDERMWQPSVDKSGNGYAVIRFLPQVEEETMPYIVGYQHSFKIGSKWFIEACPSTIGQPCFCCESNSNLWNSGIDADKKIASERKRNKSYYSNILVISDKDHPENNGKVYIYRFGQRIFDKIKSAAAPEFEDDKPMNPFDFWEGANFRIKIKNVAGFRNYDDSSFASPAPLFDGDDEKLEALWKTEYKLQELFKPSDIKSYDDLKAKYLSVVGGEVSKKAEYSPASRLEDSKPQFQPKVDNQSDEDDFDMEDYAKLLGDD